MIPKLQRPYIGITDFMTNEQVKQMIDVFRLHTEESLRRLHVGVMMSRKTLYGFETRWSKVFPPNERIRDIFNPVDDVDHPNYRHIVDDIMFTLHYADYQEDAPNLFEDLMNALWHAGPFVDALQLDMIWPDPCEIANTVQAVRRPMEVILQLGKNALDEVNNDPEEAAERLFPYSSFITHVLLDKSMGKGLGMDAQALLPFARAIRKEYPNMGIAVAGGLGPDTMHLVEPFIAEFPDISIDAQGRLRPSGNALDPIDWDMAAEYVKRALALLK